MRDLSLKILTHFDVWLGQVSFYENLALRAEENELAGSLDDISGSYPTVNFTPQLQEELAWSIVGPDFDLETDTGCCPGTLLRKKGAMKAIDGAADSEDAIALQAEREMQDTGNAAKQASQMHFEQRKEVKVFMTKFSSMLAAPMVSHEAKAARIIDLLEDTFTRMWILSKHLALMVQLFEAFGARKTTEHFGSFRVELVVLLFERVVDVNNFELVLRLLGPFEVGCLCCRLGWLSLYNPMKPEGSYNLDMRVHEERLVTKMLVSS